MVLADLRSAFLRNSRQNVRAFSLTNFETVLYILELVGPCSLFLHPLRPDVLFPTRSSLTFSLCFFVGLCCSCIYIYIFFSEICPHAFRTFALVVLCFLLFPCLTFFRFAPISLRCSFVAGNCLSLIARCSLVNQKESSSKRVKSKMPGIQQK